MRELLDGLMLGDGSLQLRGNARYRHSCKEREYLEWLKEELKSHGIDFTEKVYEKPNGYGTGFTYQIYSRVNKTLTDEHKRWYPEGTKRVPDDIKITPVTLKEWYIGDGTFDSRKGYLQCISLAAHSFTYEERDRLVEQLESIGLNARNDKKGNIRILKSSVPQFFQYIGDCPVECYQYKWDYKRFT